MFNMHIIYKMSVIFEIVFSNYIFTCTGEALINIKHYTTTQLHKIKCKVEKYVCIFIQQQKYMYLISIILCFCKLN